MPAWEVSSNTLLVLPIILFMLASVVLWINLLRQMSQCGGWSDLARRHRCRGRFAGQKWRLRSAVFGGEVRYSKVLTIGADERGLYISMLWPIAHRHPPLLIPWALVRGLSSDCAGDCGAVSGKRAKARIELGEAPPVDLQVSLELFNLIQRMAPRRISTEV
jgi:hypothetical protein